jgi:hypothetical protein
MKNQTKISKPLSLWFEDRKEPMTFENSLEAEKELGKKLQEVTSGSIDIFERISVDGSTISSKSAAGLRNWAIKELDHLQTINQNLSFLDVKYQPSVEIVDKNTAELSTLPPRLTFRRSIPRKVE